MKITSITIDQSVLSGIIATSNRAMIAQHPILKGVIMIDLAMRAVACRGWRWMEGMSDTEGFRVLHIIDGIAFFEDRRETAGAFPDLGDPATLGCLLAIVREALCDSDAYAEPPTATDHHWTVWWRCGDRCVEGSSEAAALVAALECADA